MKEQNVAMQQLQQAERLMMKSMQSAWVGQRTGNTPADVQSRINSAFDSGIVPGTGLSLPCTGLSLLVCLTFGACVSAYCCHCFFSSFCYLFACMLLPVFLPAAVTAFLPAFCYLPLAAYISACCCFSLPLNVCCCQCRLEWHVRGLR